MTPTSFVPIRNVCFLLYHTIYLVRGNLSVNCGPRWPFIWSLWWLVSKDLCQVITKRHLSQQKACCRCPTALVFNEATPEVETDLIQYGYRLSANNGRDLSWVTWSCEAAVFSCRRLYSYAAVAAQLWQGTAHTLENNGFQSTVLPLSSCV